MDLYSRNHNSEILREIYIEVNKLGNITFVSPNYKYILDFTIEELLNRNIQSLLDIEDLDILFNSMNNFHVTRVNKYNKTLYFDVMSNPIFNNRNELTGAAMSLINITQYKMIEKRESKFIKMFEKSKDIVYRLELKPELKFTYISPAIYNILGITPEQCYSDAMIAFQVVHPDEYELQKNKIKKETDFTRPFPTRFKHKDGHYVWLEDYITPFFDESGELIALEGFSRDIQERKNLEDNLKRLSYTDGLTGLYNRAYLNKKIKFLKEDSNVAIAIIACDVDDFKHINDSFGHATGDMYLKNIADFLNSTFTIGSIIIRTGGDEFLVILTDISLEEAKISYSNMFSALDKYNKFKKMQINISTGFAYSNTSKSILKQIYTADKDMYKNKFRKKKNTII